VRIEVRCGAQASDLAESRTSARAERAAPGALS
jgi:hypothetical protein